jgi:pimeloyl-ACP methyl ester carboxylesterase
VTTPGSFAAAYQPRRAARLEHLPLRSGPLAVRWWNEAEDSGGGLAAGAGLAEAAAGQARLTVFLHGFLDTGETWQFLVDEWPGAPPFLALDWRGFGASPDTREPYWFPQYYADLDDLLDRVSPDLPVNLVGHSMGGNVAMAYAGLRPERVAAVASLDGHGLPRTTAADAVGTYRRWLGQLRGAAPAFGTYPSLEAFTQVLAKRHPRLRADRLAFIARAWSRPVEGGVTLAMDPFHKLANPVNYRRDEMEACWAAITSPLLVLLAEHGEFRSTLGADGALEALRRAFSRGDVVELPGVSHLLHHQRPAAVAAWLAAFLAGQPLPDVGGLE